MKKKIIVVLLAILMLSPSINVFAAVEDYSTKDFQNSVFEFQYEYKTEVPTEDPNVVNRMTLVNHGTIFAIGDGLFATAAHCISKIPGQKYWNEFYYTEFIFNTNNRFDPDKASTITVYGFYDLLYVDYKYDIAIFRGDDFMQSFSKPLDLATKYSSKDTVFTVGYPMEIEDPVMLYETGKITKLEQRWVYDQDFDGFIQDTLIVLDIDVEEGQSGSPLLNAKGQVIGMFISKQILNDEAKTFIKTYAVNIDDLKDMIDKVN